MTKEFIEKVIYWRTVDTKKYRYVAETEASGRVSIKRIEQYKLGTTAAITEWETIYTREAEQ